ncbi:MAG: hypothetical protein D6729_04330 [Deltaproteobacteria bacterium]|nr:MAG: hypothetical protein D6729_04330 [Deltaproteobacteria bacterium]
MRTKALEAIERRMKEVPPGSYRYQVLATARDFKNAWIELGHELTKVRDGKLYKEWGYEDFESYCERELHIRKATAHKLTATYGFMQRREPELLREAHARPEVRAELPEFEVVEVLSRAEERGQIGDANYAAVRERVFGEAPVTPVGLSRLINRDYPPPPAPEPPPEKVLERLARTMRRVADEAGRSSVVPPALASRAEALAADFESLLAGRDAA